MASASSPVLGASAVTLLPVVSPLMEQRRNVERQMNEQKRARGGGGGGGGQQPPSNGLQDGAFDFLSLRESTSGSAGGDGGSGDPAAAAAEALKLTPSWLHAQAAAQDAATVAINADRILQAAMAANEAEADARAAARKKERKVRYIMSDSDPLIKACKRGDVEAIRELLALVEPEELLDYVNARDKNGSTPIFHPVWPGHLEALRVLLEAGADPNKQNNRQNTALHLACEREHTDLILLLIQFGANITLQNANNQRCFNMLVDPTARSRCENFVRRALNDVRRGQAGSDGDKFRLDMLAANKKPDYWNKSFYAESFWMKTTHEKRAQLRAQLAPSSTTLLKAVSEPSSAASHSHHHAANEESNEAGVPDVSDEFKRSEPSADRSCACLHGPWALGSPLTCFGLASVCVCVLYV